MLYAIWPYMPYGHMAYASYHILSIILYYPCMSFESYLNPKL